MLAKGIEPNDKHSAIMESHSLNTYVEKKAFESMASTPQELARRFEEQFRCKKSSKRCLKFNMSLSVSLRRW